MALIFTILLLGISLLGYLQEKKSIVNPITIFCGLWGVVMLFSSLGLYTMQAASNSTNVLFFLGTILFVLGYYFNKFILRKCQIRFTRQFTCKKTHSGKRTAVFIPRYNILYILTIICIFFGLSNLIDVFRKTGTLNLGTIQNLLQSGEYEQNRSPVVNALSFLVISPISFAIPAITASDFWLGKKDRKMLILTIILAVVNMLSSANRTTLILPIFFLILTAYIKAIPNATNVSVMQKRQGRKIRKYIVRLAGLGVLCFIVMTLSRGSQIIRNIYLNFSMPPRMFEIWKEKVEKHHVYGYGSASFLGFFYPFFYILKNINCLEKLPDLIQSIYDWTMLTDIQWVQPGTKISANAYVSLFWFFYLDARMAGVLIGSFAFGIISSKSYLNALSKSAKSAASYCMIFYAILFSFVRFQFALTKFTLAILFILMIAYKKSQ